jgi:hypothetical protein
LHHLHASGPADALAAIDQALAPWIDARFRAARQTGEREPFEARAFDALFDLMAAAPPPARAGAAPPAPPEAGAPEPASPAARPEAGVPPAPSDAATARPHAATLPDAPTAPADAEAPPGGGVAPPGGAPPDVGAGPAGGAPSSELPDGVTPAPRPARRRTPDRYKIVIRADLDALVRGAVAGDETCEIAGVGPIAVTAVRDLLGDAALHLVLTKGTAVANVTHLGRGPTAAQRIALLWQAPQCTRLGCPRRAHLQIDHRKPWAQCRITELANLDSLCRHDHDVKTRNNWALVAGTGRRPMVPPSHPDHPARAGKEVADQPP